jgi:hypothetical protein
MKTSECNSDAICFKYPEFECLSGWNSIIESVILCIDRHIKRMKNHPGYGEDIALSNRPGDFEISQVKEKNGGLRIYCYNADEYIDGVIALAEAMAHRTCEVTGDPGSLHQLDGYFRTVSERIAKENGYKSVSRDRRRQVGDASKEKKQS